MSVDVLNMTAAEREALLAQLRDIKKQARDAEAERYSEMLRDFVETILLEQEMLPSDYSSRVGYSTPSLSLEIDGRQYTFYVSLKDVEASKDREEQIALGNVVLKKKEAPKKAS